MQRWTFPRLPGLWPQHPGWSHSRMCLGKVSVGAFPCGNVADKVLIQHVYYAVRYGVISSLTHGFGWSSIFFIVFFFLQPSKSRLREAEKVSRNSTHDIIFVQSKMAMCALCLNVSKKGHSHLKHRSNEERVKRASVPQFTVFGWRNYDSHLSCSCNPLNVSDNSGKVTFKLVFPCFLNWGTAFQSIGCPYL